MENMGRKRQIEVITGKASVIPGLYISQGSRGKCVRRLACVSTFYTTSRRSERLDSGKRRDSGDITQWSRYRIRASEIGCHFSQRILCLPFDFRKRILP